MCGAHDDVGHIVLERMFNILCDRFYWPNLEADAIHHVCTCEWCVRFQSKQDKAELYPLSIISDLISGVSPHGLFDNRKPHTNLLKQW